MTPIGARRQARALPRGRRAVRVLLAAVATGVLLAACAAGEAAKRGADAVLPPSDPAPTSTPAQPAGHAAAAAAPVATTSRPHTTTTTTSAAPTTASPSSGHATDTRTSHPA